jgi:hypothetical protein
MNFTKKNVEEKPEYEYKIEYSEKISYGWLKE